MYHKSFAPSVCVLHVTNFRGYTSEHVVLCPRGKQYEAVSVVPERRQSNSHDVDHSENKCMFLKPMVTPSGYHTTSPMQRGSPVQQCRGILFSRDGLQSIPIHLKSINRALNNQ